MAKYTISEYDTIIGMLNELKPNESKTYYTEKDNIKFIVRKIEK